MGHDFVSVVSNFPLVVQEHLLYFFDFDMSNMYLWWIMNLLYIRTALPTLLTRIRLSFYEVTVEFIEWKNWGISVRNFEMKDALKVQWKYLIVWCAVLCKAWLHLLNLSKNLESRLQIIRLNYSYLAVRLVSGSWKKR